MCVGFHLGGEQRLGSRLCLYDPILVWSIMFKFTHTHTRMHAHTHAQTNITRNHIQHTQTRGHKILRLLNARKHLGTVCVYMGHHYEYDVVNVIGCACIAQFGFIWRETEYCGRLLK